MDRQNCGHDRGFTLLEVLIVASLLGVLMAIAAPSWNAFRHRQMLNVARSEALAAIRYAQSQAIQKRTKWQASFREIEGQVQWATHSADVNPALELANVQWHNFPQGIRLDEETTLRLAKGVRQVQFNYLGHVNGQLGRVTFTTNHGGTTKRCVVVSTLLGALREGENRSKKDAGKTCW